MNGCNNCPPGQIPYTVRSGDTLWAIAKSYKTTVDDILKINPNIDPERLRVGEKLCLPFEGEIYPNCRTGNYYVVRDGIRLETVAAYFGVEPRLLYQNNMGIDPSKLFEGQVLCIPVAPSPVRIVIDGGTLTLVHKSGATTDCKIDGEFFGTACVINKQLEIGVSGSGVLDLSDGGAIRGLVGGKKGLTVANEDMDALFNLVPVGTLVSGQR